MTLLGNCDSPARVPYGTLGNERVNATLIFFFGHGGDDLHKVFVTDAHS